MCRNTYGHNFLHCVAHLSLSYYRYENYGRPVDIWAIGCIMGELVDGQPLFPGDSDIDQLYIIQKIFGPITSDQHAAFLRNPRFVGLKFPDMSKPQTLEKRYAGRLSPTALTFIKSLLRMNENHRATSEECLADVYLAGKPRGGSVATSSIRAGSGTPEGKVAMMSMPTTSALSGALVGQSTVASTANSGQEVHSQYSESGSRNTAAATSQRAENKKPTTTSTSDVEESGLRTSDQGGGGRPMKRSKAGRAGVNPSVSPEYGGGNSGGGGGGGGSNSSGTTTSTSHNQSSTGRLRSALDAMSAVPSASLSVPTAADVAASAAVLESKLKELRKRSTQNGQGASTSLKHHQQFQQQQHGFHVQHMHGGVGVGGHSHASQGSGMTSLRGAGRLDLSFKDLQQVAHQVNDSMSTTSSSSSTAGRILQNNKMRQTESRHHQSVAGLYPGAYNAGAFSDIAESKDNGGPPMQPHIPFRSSSRLDTRTFGDEGRAIGVGSSHAASGWLWGNDEQRLHSLSRGGLATDGLMGTMAPGKAGNTSRRNNVPVDARSGVRGGTGAALGGRRPPHGENASHRGGIRGHRQAAAPPQLRQRDTSHAPSHPVSLAARGFANRAQLGVGHDESSNSSDSTRRHQRWDGRGGGGQLAPLRAFPRRHDDGMGIGPVES